MADYTVAEIDQARARAGEIARRLASDIRAHRTRCDVLGCIGLPVAMTVAKLTDDQRSGLLFAALIELAGPDPRVALPESEGQTE